MPGILFAATEAPTPLPQIPTHAELFLAFFKVSISGFGGTLPWTRRMFVEEKHWMTAEEFNDSYAVCQFLPGPNIVNLTSVFGARMLSRIRLWEPIAPIVLHHHEHWDGHGYPEGRSGEGIPLEARIVAIADAVDAMQRGEGSRAAKSPDEIVKELQRCRGTQFDPALVDAFLTLHGRGESGVESL